MIKICDPGIKTKYTVADFERAIADFVGYPFAVATNTGTAALHLALRAMGADSCETVRIPPVCFRAVVNAIAMVRARPIYDHRDKYSIDVMNYGFPAVHDYKQILDASEALGGDIPLDYQIVTLSFNWNKPITCGSGGMLLTHSGDIAAKARLWANQSKIDSTYFVHLDQIGYNYRMNDLQATMGMESLSMWPTNCLLKRLIYKRYLETDLPIIKPPEGFRWNHWITLLRTPKREAILQAFRENDIETRAMFSPHTREFPEVNKFADETMCLPSSPGLTEEEQAKVIQVVKGVL